MRYLFSLGLLMIVFSSQACWQPPCPAFPPYVPNNAASMPNMPQVPMYPPQMPQVNRNRTMPPSVQIQANADAYQVYVYTDKPDQFEVKLQPGQLVIQSSQSSQVDEHDSNRYYYQQQSSQFQRSMSLPYDADVSKAYKSEIDGGVLLTIPRLSK